MNEIEIEEFEFDTSAEAEAFLRGVRYVDDGVHTVVGVQKKKMKFVAVVRVELSV